MNKFKNIEYLIIFFLGLFLFGFLIHGLTFIKNIGLYGSIIFFLMKLVINKERILYKEYYLNNRMLFNAFFIFILSVLVSIIFAYSNIKPSLKEFRIEFLNIGIFMLISLNILNKKLLYKILLYSIILAFIYDVMIYGYEYYLNNPKLNFSIRLNRNFANYFEYLYPFLLGGIFILPNKIKYFLLMVLIIGFIELLLTGARGTWISIIFETILFFIFILFINKNYLKNILTSIILIIIVLSSIVLYMYNHSNLIKYKIAQGLETSGRNIIITTRLPIFIENENIFIGIGGPGNYQYNKFLNNYNAPKVYGKNNGNEFHYWSDEPFLLQIFYKEGLLGLISFLFLSIIFLWQTFKLLKYNINIKDKFFVISILSSYVGYYFIRGLVEGRSFKYILLYLTLYLIIKEKNND